jgi:hypothetical protein
LQLGGGRVDQRLDEAVGPYVRGEQQLDRRGEGEPPGEGTQQPARDGYREQPGQQLDEAPLGQLLAGQVVGVQRDDRDGEVADDAPLHPGQPGLHALRLGPVRVDAERQVAGEDGEHEQQPQPEAAGYPQRPAAQQLGGHEDGHDREDEYAQAERPPQREERDQAE